MLLSAVGGGAQAQAQDPAPAQAPAPAQEPAPRTGLLLVSPVSGVYADDQILTVEGSAPGLALHYSFRDAAGAEGPWIPYRAPLDLSAARGEQRDYRLIVRADSSGEERERRELSIRIDKRMPPAPRIFPDSGTFWDPVSVKFSAPAQDIVYYAVQGDVVRQPTAWDGHELSVGQPDESGEYVVQACSVSQSGNRSRIVTARYRVETRAPVLDVLSPVAGTFANPQALAVTFRNLQWVRYTLDGSDPATGGIAYTGPFTVDRRGTTTIRIAGQPRSASRPMIRRDVTVTYTSAEGTGLRLDTENGSYPAGISPQVLASPGGSLYYALWEKTPNESDQLVTGGISISSQTGGPSPIVLRLRALSAAGSWGPEYRYFYFVGQGGPSVPSLTLNAQEPLRGPVRAQVTAPEDSLLALTTDGSAPVARGVSPSTWVDFPAVSPGAAVVVKAAAFDGSGAMSQLMERRLAAAGPDAPAPSLGFAAGPSAGTAILNPPAGVKGGLAYEITSDGSDPDAPGPDSPRLAGPLVVSVPFGTSRTFKARAALVEDSGSVRGSSQVVSIAVDRTPPPEPRLVPPAGTLDEPTSLAVSGGGNVTFTLTSDGSTPQDPDPRFSPSNSFVALPGVPGAVVTYRLKVLASDGAGNSTEVYGPYLYSVDLRPPVIPSISGIADGGRYNARQVSVSIEESAWTVRYTASSDGTEPPEPDLKSPVLSADTVFSGEVGAQTLWRLKLLAISHNGKRVGEKRALSFVIDLKAPEVPKLQGIPDSGRVARPVTLVTEPTAADTHVLYTLTSDGSDPADPGVSGAALPASLTVDSPEGVRKEYAVRISSVDDAGNKSLYNRLYGFTIDRELPDDPEVRGAVDGVVSGRPLTVTVASREQTVVLEMTDDGSIPRLPTPASTGYSGPLLLAGKPGAAVTYRILARAFNELGTASRAARIITLTIDRTIPSAPPTPLIQFDAGNPAVAYLSWPAAPAGKLLYSLGSPGAAGGFTAYSGPVSVAVDPDHGSTITGSAVVENPAGARSSAAAFSVTVGKRLLPPVISGARDGILATQRIELRAGAPEGEVRYEVATDGSFPPTVTTASPRFPDRLVLDAADGQTVEARVAARAFDPSGAAIPSDQVQLSASIDRTPPDPPVAAGIEDGGHYQDNRTVRLLSAEGEIYDSISTGAEPVIPSQTDASHYTSPLELQAAAGQSVTYHIVAFSVDPAGNRSREIRSWTITIDKKIVYAAPTGSDYADGSRDAPVRSIGRALEIAADTGRKAVFAAAGAYTEDSQVEIPGDVTISGGLDPDTWEPLGLERWSVLSAARPWRSGTSLLSVKSGVVAIKGFDLQEAAGPVASLVSVSGGTLQIEQSALTLRGPGEGQGLAMSAGSLSLVNCRFAAEGSWNGAFVDATGGTVSASGSGFTGPKDTTDFAVFDVQNVHGLELKGVTIDPGAGQRTRGIRAVGSDVSLSGSKAVSGSGLQEAVAVDVRDSRLTLDNADIATVSTARSPAAIIGVGGSVQVSRSRVAVDSSASAVGLSARGSDVVLLRTTIKASDTREYLSLVRLEDSRALIADSLLVGARAGQSVAVQVKGGSTDILNNTIVAGTGSSFTTGILVQGDQFPRLVNNIVARQGASQGTAITVLDARSLALGAAGGRSAIMLANSFGGWSAVLRAEHARDLAQSPLEIPTADALNARDADVFGGPISGNKAEPASASFRSGQADGYRLSRSSVCVEGGVDLTSSGGPGGTGPIQLKSASEISADFLGNPRPGAVPLASPGPARGWDIGAYEYVE